MAFPGWNETLEYADDPNNVAIYDVNTIANYDGDIVALLDEPAPVAKCSRDWTPVRALLVAASA
jgi:hypothetical protein